MLKGAEFEKSREEKLIGIKTIISDWSGVFSDDRKPVYEANMRVIEKHGKIRVSFDEWLPITRLTPVELFKDFGIDDDHDVLFEEYRKTYSQVRREGIHPVAYPDVKDFLTGLKAKRIPIVVVSSHPEQNLRTEAIEYGIDHYFEGFYGNLKDKAAAIQMVCGLKNIHPSSTAYIGDTIYDVQEAKKAKAKSVAVATGYHVRKRLAEENPDLLLNSLSELINKLI